MASADWQLYGRVMKIILVCLAILVGLVVAGMVVMLWVREELIIQDGIRL